MSSWRTQMPAGMCLKSTPDASSLGSPVPGYTLSDYCASEGIRPLAGDEVVPIQLFTRYGQWFQQCLVPDVEDETIREIRRTGRGFHLTLGSGEELLTPRVVVATGITGLAYVPPELASITPDGPSAGGPVSHSSQHDNLAGFRGARVAVIGAGQSALESAALLREAGAVPTVLARETARFGSPPVTPTNPFMAKLPQPHSPLGPTWRIYPFSHAAGLFPYLPAETRLRLVKRVLGPLGAWWLADRVVGRVPILNGHAVRGATQDASGVALTTSCTDGQHTTIRVDHVLAATGYRVDLAKLGVPRARAAPADPADRHLPAAVRLLRVLGARPVLRRPARRGHLRAAHAVRLRRPVRGTPGERVHRPRVADTADEPTHHRKGQDRADLRGSPGRAGPSRSHGVAGHAAP